MVFTDSILVELPNLNSRDNGFRKHMETVMISIRFQNSVTLSPHHTQRFGFCSHIYGMQK